MRARAASSSHEPNQPISGRLAQMGGCSDRHHPPLRPCVMGGGIQRGGGGGARNQNQPIYAESTRRRHFSTRRTSSTVSAKVSKQQKGRQRGRHGHHNAAIPQTRTTGGNTQQQEPHWQPTNLEGAAPRSAGEAKEGRGHEGRGKHSANGEHDSLRGTFIRQALVREHDFNQVTSQSKLVHDRVPMGCGRPPPPHTHTLVPRACQT